MQSSMLYANTFLNPAKLPFFARLGNIRLLRLSTKYFNCLRQSYFFFFCTEYPNFPSIRPMA